ncbi:hypothetical protein KIN20_028550, partial [Parelaphostrongylus tenuis]
PLCSEHSTTGLTTKSDELTTAHKSPEHVGGTKLLETTPPHSSAGNEFITPKRKE